jgi:dienelactone hydrolase
MPAFLRLTLALAVSLWCSATLAAVQNQAPDQDVSVRAHAFVDLLTSQQFDKMVAEFNAQMKAALTEDRLRATWTGLVAQAGAFKRQVSATTGERGTFKVVVISCEFERATLEIQVVYDQAGLVAGLSIRPPTSTVAYTPPAYTNSAAYTEKDVTVGTAPWALPGTLTVPVGAGPFPAVVLVQGSGPNDRDETILANKPFKDLALGLGSRGIAVLRYEKRTKQYGAQLQNVASLTVKEETVDDALLAVQLLRNEPGIDPSRIFVIGHSLGGMLVPRIGAADPKIAGFVVMAGAVRSLEQSILDQTRYLAMADGTVSPAEQEQIDQMEVLVNTVRTLTASDAASPKSIAGAPAAYWLDLRGYDPPAAARSLTRPLLVLQGERDYQVTMDDFAKWKAALDGKPTVTFHSYPALNHLFIGGTGKSLPAEYSVAGHVSEDVVRDIAAWIGTVR